MARRPSKRSSRPKKAICLNVLSDDPDIRDYPYSPPLAPVPHVLLPPENLRVLDQGGECDSVAFALAAVINRMCELRGQQFKASPRMLGQMALRFSRQRSAGSYEGTCCRDAIRGWAAMGVCAEKYWPYKPGKLGAFSIVAAKNARMMSAAAYYRVPKCLADMQSALDEAGVILCSAQVHSGWQKVSGEGVIPLSERKVGGHAFAVVGYTDTGFLVQNSWGSAWGKNGLAVWNYDDWNINVWDAWVFRLSPFTPTPRSVADRFKATQPGNKGCVIPRRSLVAGHFANFEDGGFYGAGTFWSDLEDVRQTAKFLQASQTYDHLLLYAHGGVYRRKTAMEHAAAKDQVLKANRIYPFHLMLDARIATELQRLIYRQEAELNTRVGDIPQGWDPIVEGILRAPGRALWREIKRGARSTFLPGGAGRAMLDVFLDLVQSGRKNPLKLHLVGHSSGGIVLAHLLDALEDLSPTLRVRTVSLLGATVEQDLFQTHYLPLLETPPDGFGIDKLALYNLDAVFEKRDSIGPYRKSFLYLVKNALEEDSVGPLVGMQGEIDGLLKASGTPKGKGAASRLKVTYSDDRSSFEARTHRGLEDDPEVLNTILRDVLGSKPTVAFTAGV